MASNLSRTSFGSSPKKGTEVIDAYTSGKLDRFISTGDATGAATAIDALYPGVNAEKALEFVSDPDVLKFLSENGIDLSAAFKSIDNNLPSKVDKNGLWGSATLSQLYTWGPKLKAAIPRDIYNELDTDSYKVFLVKLSKFAGSYGSTDSTGQADLLRRWGKSAGILDGNVITSDTVVNAACKGGIVEYLAGTGLGEELVSYIYDDDTLPATFKRKLIGDLAIVAGKKNAWNLLDAILLRVSGQFSAYEMRETIKGILAGFNLSSSERSDISLASTSLLGRLDKIDTVWDKKDRETVTLEHMKYLRYATGDALNTLGANERTQNIAVCFKAHAPRLRDFSYYYEKDFLPE